MHGGYRVSGGLRVQGLYGESRGKGPALVLLHGFTGSGRSFGTVRRALSQQYRVITVDALGHGRSAAPLDPTHYALPRAAQDLLQLLYALQVDDFGLLGYSMGGRLALHLALLAPQRVRALVLESVSAGIADAVARLERRSADARLARLLQDEGLEPFVQRWEAQPLFMSQSRLSDRQRAHLRQRRLLQGADGLAMSLLGAGSGSQAYLGGDLGTIACPVLLIAGADDSKYVSTLSEMAPRFPDARLAIVKSAGHTVHLEQPAEYLGAVFPFLSSHHDGERWLSR